MSSLSFRPHSLLKDIRFWILFFLLLHLYGITFPPLETGHNWRQSIVNMVARNFLEVNANIFFPRVDMAGSNPGISGMELPLLNYLIYLVASVFGWEHWYGRAIVLLSSSVGTLFFHRTVRKLFDRELALYASLILLSSIWYSYSRKVMPDIFACSLVMIAYYHGLRFLEKSKGYKDLLLYGGLGTLGVLAKLPAGFLFVLFIPFFFSPRSPGSRRRVITAVSGCMLIPVLAWYFWWVPYLVDTYGAWSFPMSRDLGTGAAELLERWPTVLKRFYSDAIKYIGFFCYLGGIVLAFIRKERKLLVALGIGIPAFLLFMIKAGVQFPKHDYYVAPFVPLMALLAAYFIERLPRPRWIGGLLLTAIVVEGVANRYHTVRLHEKHRELIELEADMEKISDPGDLIMVNSGRNPTPLYFAHRKGWLANNKRIKERSYLKEHIQKGCEYLLILKKSFTGPVEPPLGEKVLEKPAYVIYELRE
ncbi:MAG: ArnT family glycosyltransferase [Flavobacteriales bacterium]